MPEQHIISDDFTRRRLIQFIKQLDLTGRPWKFTWSRHRTNSWPMKKTWRMWMRETAEWMARNGATMPLCMRNGQPWGSRPFSEQDAHELFVKTHLGVDANGERYKTASGDRGQMLHMMDKHLAWCTERGIMLTIPREGEYMQYKEAHEQ